MHMFCLSEKVVTCYCLQAANQHPATIMPTWMQDLLPSILHVFVLQTFATIPYNLKWVVCVVIYRVWLAIVTRVSISMS